MFSIYILIYNDGTGILQYWTYGNPSKWVTERSEAREYAKRQSALNARTSILRSHREIKPDEIIVQEIHL